MTCHKRVAEVVPEQRHTEISPAFGTPEIVISREVLDPQILYDGSDPEAVAALRRITCVTLFFVRQPFASPAEMAAFEAQYAGAFGAPTRP